MLGDAPPPSQSSKDGILAGDMTPRLPRAYACLTVLFAVRRIGSTRAPLHRHAGQGQSDQQMNNDQFDCESPGAKQTGYNPDKH